MPAGGAQHEVTPQTLVYCRAARRLRGRWTHRPHRLHVELRKLSLKRDRLTASAPVERDLSRGKCEAFAAEVLRRLDEPVLRHAERRRLLGIARGVGVGRFEANLIIAAVQHERRTAHPKVIEWRLQPSPGRFPVGLVALVLALESAIALGIWFVLYA